MPLIMITGLPTSGKSTRAKQLYDFFTEKITFPADEQASPVVASDSAMPVTKIAPTSQPSHRIHLISDQALSISRTVYDLSPATLPKHTRSANASEKDARAAISSAVKRVLSPRDIVILDGLNYIKGWRYQLHCEAKNQSTPSAVLQIGCTRDKAREVNQGRLRRREDRMKEESDGWDDEMDAEGAYEKENWENLLFRYEEPNPMARWDRPLFTLIWEDDENRTRQVFDDIWDAVTGEASKKIKPNQVAMQRGGSAAAVNGGGASSMQLMNRETQFVIDKILGMQGDEGGGEVAIPRTDGRGDDLVVELPMRKLTLSMLNQYKRDFMSLKRAGIGLERAREKSDEDIDPAMQLRKGFVWHLNNIFEKIE